jgi:hypothetical protein
MLAPPSVVGTEAGHGWLPEADGADAAVVFAVCVELLEPSPGNCVARCGLTDGEALMPTVDSPLAELGCGIGTVVGIVDAGTFSGSVPQPLALPAGEHDVLLRLVPPGVGWLATVGPVTDAELPGAVVPAAVPAIVVLPVVVVVEPVWT